LDEVKLALEIAASEIAPSHHVEGNATIGQLIPEIADVLSQKSQMWNSNSGRSSSGALIISKVYR
jgi:hypothetical protein